MRSKRARSTSGGPRDAARCDRWAGRRLSRAHGAELVGGVVGGTRAGGGDGGGRGGGEEEEEEEGGRGGVEIAGWAGGYRSIARVASDEGAGLVLSLVAGSARQSPG